MELFCRNTRAFIDLNTTKSGFDPQNKEPLPSGYYDQATTRTSRRMNAWQQSEDFYDFDQPSVRGSRRAAPVSYAGMD